VEPVGRAVERSTADDEPVRAVRRSAVATGAAAEARQ